MAFHIAPWRTWIVPLIYVGLELIAGTIRRFLEQYGDSIESVIFVLDSKNYGIYQVLSSLYFPRSVHEAEYSRHQLPSEIGDLINGEPVINDRKIRIIDNPQHSFQGTQALRIIQTNLKQSLAILQKRHV